MSKYAKPWNIKWEQPSQIASRPDDMLCDQSVKIYNALKCQMEKKHHKCLHILVTCYCVIKMSRLYNALTHQTETVKYAYVQITQHAMGLDTSNGTSHHKNVNLLTMQYTMSVIYTKYNQHHQHVDKNSKCYSHWTTWQFHLRTHVHMHEAVHTHTHRNASKEFHHGIIHWPDCAGLLVLLQLWKKKIQGTKR